MLAYQYFERSYGIEAAGSITLSPERQPGAGRLKQIRARIGRVKIGLRAKSGTLDPLGAGLAEGPEQYFQLLNDLVASLGKCLN